ncbi:MAG TPA: hypothetical protein VF736_19235 [Pyrinomonadaceae bacterium]|jgi:hypothetical protein
MSEYIVLTGTSGSEHTTRRVLTGEAEAVRARLVYALESLGYTVFSDSPLQARRARRKDIFRADFTDHGRRLGVGLRQVGAAATQATFDFVVTHGGCMTRGDLQTLEREADAVVALASAQPEAALCRACGTEQGEGGRFCRLCGAPSAAGAPAEVEVLRLTAGSRAGLQEVACGLLLILLSAAATAPLMLWGKPKAANAGLILLVVGEVIGWVSALYGLLRIHRTLNFRPEAQTHHAAPDAADAGRLPHAEAHTLPHATVTEGTTELLGAAPRVREKVPLRRERSDTSPIS